MIALKLTDILYKYVNKRKDKKKIAEKQIKEDNNNMECECTYIGSKLHNSKKNNLQVGLMMKNIFLQMHICTVL